MSMRKGWIVNLRENKLIHGLLKHDNTTLIKCQFIHNKSSSCQTTLMTDDLCTVMTQELIMWEHYRVKEYNIFKKRALQESIVT